MSQTLAEQLVNRARSTQQEADKAWNEILERLTQPSIKVEAIFSPPSSAIDVRQPPVMIRIAADGSTAKAGAPHVVVLLPQYGLMFSAETPVQASNHDQALQLATDTKLLGHSDWRLPEDTELQLLIRRDRHSPAIDTEYFPHTPTSDWYWTATQHASYPGGAWYVNFSNGYVNGFRRYGSGFVRAVRSVPPSQ